MTPDILKLIIFKKFINNKPVRDIGMSKIISLRKIFLAGSI